MGVFTNLRVWSFCPGRVRFQVPALWDSAVLAHTLQTRLEHLPGVEQVRVNRAACSVLVCYHPPCLATDDAVAQWHHTLTGLLSRAERAHLSALLGSPAAAHGFRQAVAQGVPLRQAQRFRTLLQALASQP
ncbi:MAG: hypothetical protein U1F76_22425 [Candidatus Competibacteraceae bacterium]